MLRAPLTLLLTLAWAGVNAQAGSHQGLADMLMEYLDARYPAAHPRGDVLYVAVRRQQLFHVRDGRMVAIYTISTSANGLGSTRDSHRTPEGLHRVEEKVGANVPSGGVLRDREFTGEIAGAAPMGDDVITSRILWLGGLEPGENQGGAVDSHARSIYIHGTADDASLGRPVSHGCIRMSDADVITLFDAVPIGALVVILDN